MRAISWLGSVMTLFMLLAGATVARGDDADRLEVIVMGSVGSIADAKKELKKWEAEKAAVSNVIKLAPGFPKIIGNAEARLLRPGEYVLAAGACRATDVKRSVAGLEVFNSSIGPMNDKRYRDGVSCPEYLDGWGIQKKEWIENKGLDLVGVLYHKDSAESEKGQSLLHLYLRNYVSGTPNYAALLDHKELVFPPGCAAELSKDGEEIWVKKSCGPDGEAKEVLRFAVVNGKIGPAPELGRIADLQAVIWGGGKSEAEAQEALKRWQSESQELGELMKLAPGFPKIVKSDEYAGLKPGFQIVLLGVCPAERLVDPMKALKALRSDVYSRKVAISAGEPACPNLKDRDVRQVERFRTGGYELTAITYGETYNVPKSQWTSDFMLYLHDSKGNLVERKKVTTSEVRRKGGTVGSCVHEGMRVGRDGIEVAFHCDYEAGINDIRTYKETFTYRVRGGKIAVREDVQ